jgi:hypothetical protein
MCCDEIAMKSDTLILGIISELRKSISWIRGWVERRRANMLSYKYHGALLNQNHSPSGCRRFF